MSFIEMAFKDAKEKECVPEGMYVLRAEDYTAYEDDNGEISRISVRHSIEGEPSAKAVFHNLWFPRKGDDPEKVNNKLVFIKRYLELFNVPYKDGGFEPEEIPGSTAECQLVIDTYNDVESNQIKLRF